jgi:outer membrane receptor for monomeric catechols
VADWNANLFTRYRFTRGFLRNLTVGGGVNLVARRFIGSREVGTETVFDYSEGYERYSAFLAYELKSRHAAWKFQLNVDNVLDDDGFRYTALNPNGVGLQFRIQDPRSYRVSVSSKF